jgi:hypothetical protein
MPGTGPEQLVGTRRADAGAQAVKHVDLRENGADEPPRAEHRVGLAELVQNTAEAAENLVVDPAWLHQRTPGPPGIIRIPR